MLFSKHTLNNSCCYGDHLDITHTQEDVTHLFRMYCNKIMVSSKMYACVCVLESLILGVYGVYVMLNVCVFVIFHVCLCVFGVYF